MGIELLDSRLRGLMTTLSSFRTLVTPTQGKSGEMTATELFKYIIDEGINEHINKQKHKSNLPRFYR